MVDYKPQALDLSDVGQTLTNGPATNAFYAGVARRNPFVLGGWMGAEQGQLKDAVNRAYSENAQVNDMLNQLAQGELYNDARKNEIDLAKQGIQGFSSDGYRRSIGDIFRAMGYEGLGGELYGQGSIGDEFNLDNIQAQAYQRRKSADAAMVNAQANQSRANQENKLKTVFKPGVLPNTFDIQYTLPGFQTEEQIRQLTGGNQGDAPFPQIGDGLDPTEDALEPAATNRNYTLENIDNQMKMSGFNVVDQKTHKVSRDGRNVQYYIYQNASGQEHIVVTDEDGNVLEAE